MGDLKCWEEIREQFERAWPNSVTADGYPDFWDHFWDHFWDQETYVASEACKRIAELEAELSRLTEANRWIPVGDRLPEHHGNVWGWVEGRAIIVCLTSEGWRTMNYISRPDVTHWRPLPEGPES